MSQVEDKESLARAQLPYRAEYCKTSRAKCKKCQEQMEAGSLKLAFMTKSRFHDGYDASYCHVNCFFLIKRPTSVAEISHFETLKYEDQKMLEKAIESNGKSVLASGSKAAAEGKSGKKGKSKKAAKRAPDEDVNYQDFTVEYAKSGRAKCCTCQEAIPKGEVRFAKMDYAADDIPGAIGPVPRWHHVECFAKSQEQLEFFGCVEKVPNFESLEFEDKMMLKKLIKPMKPPTPENGDTSKKVKSEDEKEAQQEELALKIQSERFHALRSKLNEIRKSELEELLEFMGQKHNFKAATLTLDLAADCLLFGPLKPCPKCKKPGTMILRNSSYICTSGSDSEKPCDYETRDPQRSVPDFPDEFVEKYPYFAEQYEFVEGKRIFPKNLLKAVEQKEAENNNLVQEGAPLEGLSIGVISWAALKNDKEKIQKKVITLGGRVTTVIDSSIFVILSNKNELDKVTPKMEVAKDLGIPFAKEDFLFNLKTKDDVVPQLTKCLIGEWDGKLKARYEKMSSSSQSTQ
uniref:Poly [ADP-ribose] polymerase n=1 Tax=Aceria tosichella TaxID=561515 RepID=A0A6G1SNT4_9ACAR